MNMIMDDIVTQRESSRRWIRYEAHKFRQRSGKFFNHPRAQSAESQRVNIAPPGWVEKYVNSDNRENSKKGGKKEESDDSDDEYDEDTTDRNDKVRPKTTGIITRGRKPVVKFSVNLETNDSQTARKEFSEETVKVNSRESYIRSVSALQCRETYAFPEQPLKRQKSATPMLNRKATDNSSASKRQTQYTEIHVVPFQTSCIGNEPISSGQSDKFFDRSKAAYELRLDLKRKASLRKQRLTPTSFTIRDALQMEREKFCRSREKVVSYMDRVEAIKRAERTVITKWNRGAFEQQLSL